jgi:hypothetical protein
MHLRERVEELEPLLTETQSERFQLQKQGEVERQERSELLLRVFRDVNKFLGADVSSSVRKEVIIRNGFRGTDNTGLHDPCKLWGLQGCSAH